MIKILHTADLHLGKTLHERDLTADQTHMLGIIARCVAERHADILLIAGDIYDRSIPPPEAVRLFDSFISDLMRDNPGLSVVIIPGNHDSAARLSFGARLLSREGLHIRTSASACTEPVRYRSGEDSLAIWALPFLNPGSFSPRSLPVQTPAQIPARAEGVPGSDGDASDRDASQDRDAGDRDASQDRDAGDRDAASPRSQSELMAEALSRIRAVMDPLETNILVAHCFAAGASPGASERGFVGAAEQVDVELFGAFDYTALGHLHRFQRRGKEGTVCYPGSPLAYSFGESGEAKGFVLVGVEDGRIDIEFIPLAPLHRMRRIEGRFSELAAFPGSGDISDRAGPEMDYIEVSLTDPDPVINPTDALRMRYPNILSVHQTAFELAVRKSCDPDGVPDDIPGGMPESGGTTNPLESLLRDFSDFHLSMKGLAPDATTAGLFAELAAEVEHEAL